MARRQGRKGCQVSHFKNRKFTLQWDSLGTAAWVPYEQVNAMLCEAMAIEAEAETLRRKLDWLRQAEHLVIWDGSQWRVRPEHGGKAL